MKIVYIVNSSGFFCSHFYTLAKHNLSKGHQIYVLTGDKSTYDDKDSNIKYYSYDGTRDGLNVFREFNAIWSIYKTLKSINPDVIHAFTIKSVLYSGLLIKFSRIKSIKKSIFSITGLGSLFLSVSLLKKIIWKAVMFTYRVIFSMKDVMVVFENYDDRNLFVNANIVTLEKTALVNGAGIDTSYYVKHDKECTKNAELVVVFVARMLKDKGANEFIEAARLLRERKVPVIMRMVGDCDERNISSLTRFELEAANSLGYIEFLGHRKDIKNIYNLSDIACLPSYREGLPKSLIEAASCGLPIVTTDTPGCRQVIDKNSPNGILVPVGDPYALADALQILIENRELRVLYGNSSRRLAELKFDYKPVLASFDKIYGLEELA